jgi:hypothetical protein
MTRPCIDEFVARPLWLSVRGRLAATGGVDGPDMRPFAQSVELPPHLFPEALYSGIHIRRDGQEFQIWDSFNTKTIQIGLPANAKVIFGVMLTDEANPSLAQLQRCHYLELARPELVQGTDGEALVTLQLPVGSLRLCDQRPIDQPPPPANTDGRTPLGQLQANWRGQGPNLVLTHPIFNAGDYAGPPVHDRIVSAKVVTPGGRQRRWHKRYFFHKDPAKPHLNTSIVYRDQTGAIFHAEEFTRRPDGEMVTTAFEFED